MASTASAQVEGAGSTTNGLSLHVASRLEAWLDAERDQLILWVPVLLGVGIALWFLLPTAAQWTGVATLAMAFAAAGRGFLGGRAGRAAMLGGLLIACGIGAAWFRAEMAAAPRLDREIRNVIVDATVKRVEDRSGQDQWRLFLMPADPSLPPMVRVSLRAKPADAVKPGAIVRIRATLRPPPGPVIPGGYDYSRRAWFDGVGAVGYALGAPEVLDAAPPAAGFMATVEGWRASLNARVRTLVPGQSGAIASAFVTGDQGGIDEDVAQTWRDAGIAHMLSVGGLHIAVVVGAVMVGTRRLLTLSPTIALRWPVKTIAALAAALAALSYALLAGLQVPIVRSALAALFVLLGLLAGRQALALRSVAVAAFAVLLVRPEVLVGPSFQLTFASIVALLAFFNTTLGRRLLQPSDDETFLGRWRRRLLMLALSGAVAQAALAPIALFHFNREGVYGVFANLVAIPMVEFAGMPLLMAMLFGDLLGVAAPFGWALGWLLDSVTALAAWFAALPGAVARLPTMPLTSFALIVAGGVWLCLWTGRSRLFGFVPVAAGLAAAMVARPADLVISPDGVHVGATMADGRLAMLRPRSGDYVRSMWGDAAGTGATATFDDLPNASCSAAACILLLTREGRVWRVFATRSRDWVPRPAMEQQCAAADIVISDRRLPDWCAPRWLKLDRQTLERTGAVAIRFGVAPSVDTAARRAGHHPWATSLGAGGAGG